MPHRAPCRGNRIEASGRWPRSLRSRSSREPRCSPGTSRTRKSPPGHDPSPPSISPPSSRSVGASCPRRPRCAAAPRRRGRARSCSSGAATSTSVGTKTPEADGFAFDAAARRWEPLPPSPLEGRSGSAFAWTGRELLIWGGWDGGFRNPPYFGDGAAYDPIARTWRMLPAAPIEARTAFSVWTGEEIDRLGEHGEGRAASGRRGLRPVDEHVADDRRRADRHHRRVCRLDRRRDDRVRRRARWQQPRRHTDRHRGRVRSDVRHVA